MKEQIAGILKKALSELGVKIEEEEIAKYIELPPNPELGDYAFPCFFLARTLKEEPHEIALEIREKIGNLPLDFEDIQAVGGYVNFFGNQNDFARKTISEIIASVENFGKNNLGENRSLMIEFSQPNTHKAFHVGHVRGTSIGESLARISEFSGNKVIRANYSGDTGMHVAKWLWCYMKYHAHEKLKNDESWIASIYVDSVTRLSKNEKLQKQVDEVNRKLDSREDKKLNELWRKTRKLSIESWKKIYRELNTRFDVYFFESEVEERGKIIARELLGKKIAKKSDDAIIMNLKKYGLGVWVLLRKDGTALYSVKDLALAEKKMNDFRLDKYLVTVADEQRLHFEQLVKTLELMKLANREIYDFLTFSTVRMPAGKMSSRTGDNVLYSYFINEICDYAKKEIKKRDQKISKKELEERALKIAIAAIKYSMLKQNPNKNIIFKKEEALNFEGDTGAYILYTYARANSIIKKAKKAKLKFNAIKPGQKETELVKKLSQFPAIVESSYANKNPSLIANYSYQLAQTFNEFYHAIPVLKTKEENFRLALVLSFIIVLKNALSLLGIETVEKM